MKRPRVIALTGVVIVAVAATGWMRYGRTVAPSLPTVDVKRGAFADVVEIRGEVRPVRSTLVMAPANAGELTILEERDRGQTR
jgi:hypothetical protein